MYHHTKIEPSCGYYASPQPSCSSTAMHNCKGFAMQNECPYHELHNSPTCYPTYEVPVDLPPEEGNCPDNFIIMKKRYGVWKQLNQTEISMDFIPFLQRKYPNYLQNQHKMGATARRGRPRKAKTSKTPTTAERKYPQDQHKNSATARCGTPRKAKTSETPTTAERKEMNMLRLSRMLERNSRMSQHKSHDGKPFCYSHNGRPFEDQKEEEGHGAAVPLHEIYKTHFEGCNTQRSLPSPMSLED